MLEKTQKKLDQLHSEYEERLAAEREARRIFNGQLERKVAEIGKIWGGWKLKPTEPEHADVPCPTFSLLGDFGARVYFHYEERKKRLFVSGWAPDGYPASGWDGFRASVDPLRETKVLAADLGKRVVAPYKVAYLAALAKVAEMADLKGRAKRSADSLAALFGTKARDSGGDFTVYCSKDGWGALTVRVSPGESVHVRVEGALEPAAFQALLLSVPK